tara:strand:+ start:2326 stop:2622 length:297 start_codon:yes stop_codon:yes gene_type:complete
LLGWHTEKTVEKGRSRRFDVNDKMRLIKILRRDQAGESGKPLLESMPIKMERNQYHIHLKSAQALPESVYSVFCKEESGNSIKKNIGMTTFLHRGVSG